MDDSLTLALIGLAGLGLAALAVRWGVIGIRGGSVSKHDNWLAHWIGVGVLTIASMAMLLVGLLHD
jgi:hypothetical protein